MIKLTGLLRRTTYSIIWRIWPDSRPRWANWLCRNSMGLEWRYIRRGAIRRGCEKLDK